MTCRTMQVLVDAEVYRASVLLVRSRDVNGRPLQCEVIHQDRKVDVEDGTEFLIIYMRGDELVKREPS